MTLFISKLRKKYSHTFIGYFFIYTSLFLILSAIVFSTFWINDKSMIWKPDGLTQHFNSFVYFGNWGRSILKNLLTGQGLSIPMWDFSIGYGSDVLTTLQYYCIGDPFSLFAVLTPVRFMEAMFNALILLRVFLAGIAFSCYCFYMKRGKCATLAGALSYVFCGYVIVLAPQHPSFINPLIYLPFLLTGVEKVFQKQRGHLLIFMTALSAITNFYFFYMLVILTVIYCVIRFCTMKHESWGKDLIYTGGRTLFFAAIGTAVGSVLLLPVVIQFLSDSRSSSSLTNAPLYPVDFYTQFADAFISTVYSSFWTHLGFTGLALLCVFLLFIKRKHYTGLKIGFLVLTLMLLLPAAGSFMNGFSYSVNRWCFGYCFLVSLILTFLWPDLFHLSSREKGWLAGLTFVSMALLLFLPYTGSAGAFFSLTLMLLTVLIVQELPNLNIRIPFLHRKAHKKTAEFAVLLLLILGILANSVTFFRIDPEGHIARFVEQGKGLSTLQETAAGMMSAFYSGDETFSRYAQDPMPVRNDTINHDVSSIDYYWSLSSGVITQYFDELALPMTERPFKYNSLDNRASLHALAGVEHYVRHNPADYLPHLYEETNLHEYYGNLYYVSATSDYLHLGFTYDSCISRETYENLPYIRRQQALLQGMVCDNPSGTGDSPELLFEEESIPYELALSSDMVLLDDSYYALEDGATLTFTFPGRSDCETYLLVEGLKAHSMTDVDFLKHDQLSVYFQEEWDSLSAYEKREQKKNDAMDLFDTGASAFSFTCTSKILENEFAYFTEQSESAFDRSDYLVNMGYSKEAQSTITLTLPYAGRYSFENLEILCLPQKNLTAQLGALKENVLEQVTIGPNAVTGSIALESPKFLCLSIPYSSGWQAYVDGNPVPVLQANTMFLGLELDAGEHTIKLHYQTPGLTAGLGACGMGLFLWCLYTIYDHLHTRKQKTSDLEE